jgi:hypothetical protein
MRGVWRSASICCSRRPDPAGARRTAASWWRQVFHCGTGCYGLIHLDGHTDFRHQATSSVRAARRSRAHGPAWPAIADIDRLGPTSLPWTPLPGCRMMTSRSGKPPCGRGPPRSSAATADESRPHGLPTTLVVAGGGHPARLACRTGSVKLPVFFPSFFLVSRLRRRFSAPVRQIAYSGRMPHAGWVGALMTPDHARPTRRGPCQRPGQLILQGPGRWACEVKG